MGIQGRRVLIVEGSTYFDRSIWEQTAAVSGLTVVGLAGDLNAALTSIAAVSPDLALVDLSHSALNGLALIQTIHRLHPVLPIVALLPAPSPGGVAFQLYRQAARQAGAVATLAKAELVEQLWPTLNHTPRPRPALARPARVWAAGLAKARRPVKAGLPFPQHLIGAEVGLVGGAAGVVLTIGLILIIQLLLPPSVVFLPGLFPVVLMASLASLGLSWLFSRSLHRLSPHWSQPRSASLPPIAPVFSLFTCLLQVLLFMPGW
jgi:CheY-like chemotaxis protein